MDLRDSGNQAEYKCAVCYAFRVAFDGAYGCCLYLYVESAWKQRISDFVDHHFCVACVCASFVAEKTWDKAFGRNVGADREKYSAYDCLVGVP